VLRDSVAVHLVARWVASLPQLARDVHSALHTLVGDRPVSVFVEDVEAEVLEPLSTEPAPPTSGENSRAKTVI
jgi:hypothetical protein